MITQAHYTLELEQTARKNTSTPVSYIGGYQMFRPALDAATGTWGKVGWWTLRVLYLLVVPTLFYAVMFTVVPLLSWIPWLIYTQSRRHRIRAARQAIVTRDSYVGSGELAKR